MCLDYPIEVKRNIRYGWKVFADDGGSLYSRIYGGPDVGALPVAKWLDEYDYRDCRDAELGDDNTLLPYSDYYTGVYPIGWHVYHRYRDAEDSSVGYVVWKVEIADVRAVGEQDGCKVTVCRWMRILPAEVDGEEV